MRFVAVHDVDEPLLKFRAVAFGRGGDLQVVAAEMDEGDGHYEILDWVRGGGVSWRGLLDWWGGDEFGFQVGEFC